MKAVVFDEHGDTSVLKYRDVNEPEIAADEVLVKVEACALNHLDIWVRTGLPNVKIPLPHIGGSDVSGVIEKTGPTVKNVKPGDKVIISPGTGCGTCRNCVSGADNLCRKYTLFGYMIDGGYAEYMKAPARNAIPIPQGMSFDEAAAVPLVFLTAWHMLVTRAQIKPGETVLVQAAGSGVGSAGIQIAKMFGAEVITTASSQEKLDKAKELGADHVVNYVEEDFMKRAREITNRRGVDIVFEHTGSSTFEKSVYSLTTNGRLVTCGATTGYETNIDIRYVFAKHLSIFGSYMGSLGEMHNVLKFFESGKLKAVIDRSFPLEETAAAHLYMTERRQFGKIILHP